MVHYGVCNTGGRTKLQARAEQYLAQVDFIAQPLDGICRKVVELHEAVEGVLSPFDA
jgi:hypothetical protein